MAAAKLVGFVVLLGVLFVAAHAAGVRLGPVTTGHTQVQYTGGTGSPGMGGMNMTGSNTSYQPGSSSTTSSTGSSTGGRDTGRRP